MQALQITIMKKAAIVLMIISSGLIVCFSITGCYYDNEEELYGTSCDTTNVTYSSTITGLRIIIPA